MTRSSTLPAILVLLALLAAALVLAPAAGAATWRVERDGSGDYTTIQPAVDAAASGDTILIGPGHYLEYQHVQPLGWVNPNDVFVLCHVGGLTLIGSALQDVVIGPEALFPDLPGPVGVVMEEGLEGKLRLEGLTLRNLYKGVWSKWNRLELVNCRLLNISDGGLFTDAPDGLLVEACHFDFAEVAPAISAFGPASDFVIRDSEFHLTDISFQDNTDIVVENCRFQGGQGGIQFHRSAGVVTNCELTDFNAFCVAAIGGSEVTITSCTLRGRMTEWDGSRGLDVASSSHVFMEDCIVDGDGCSILLDASAFLTAHGCHIEKSSDWYIWSNYWRGPLTGMDLTGNYWGTTDPEVIAEGILDHNDNEDLGFFIQFEPFSSEPLAEENPSLDGFKAMFR